MNSENLELAPISKRLFAFIIDDLIISILILIIFWDFIIANSYTIEQQQLAMAKLLIPLLVIKFIYQSFFVYFYSATIGKMIFKIKVIDYYTFQRVSFLNSIIRSITRIGSEYFLFLGFIFALTNEGKQTFHDKVGKTLVIHA